MADLLVSRQSPYIGRCIYCGDRDSKLSNEHAIPYGLNGNWTLLKASCKVCADITHRFERDTLKCLYPMIRIGLKLSSRRKKKMLSTLPLELEYQGQKRIEQVDLSNYPLFIPSPIFSPPMIISNDYDISNFKIEMALNYAFGPTFDEVAKKFAPVDFVGSRINFAPEYFARTLAKIGYCAGVYCFGLDALRNSELPQIILGQNRSVFKYVGGWHEKPVCDQPGLHFIKLRSSNIGIHANIRLFSQFNCPEYHVFLGQIDSRIKNSFWKAETIADNYR